MTLDCRLVVLGLLLVFLAPPLAMSAEEAVASPSAPTLSARGHEPSWRLDAGEAGVALQAPPLGLYFRADRLERRRIDGRTRLVAEARGRRLVVTIEERPCADAMTGMPFPVRVTAEIGGQRLRGCGGEMLAALEGGWRVVRLDGQPVLEGATVTLAFRRDGRAAGRSGCNRFTGPYQLTAEGLRFGPLAATRMACPPPLMQVEAQVLQALQEVTRATPGEGRRLVLLAGDRSVLTLERVR